MFMIFTNHKQQQQHKKTDFGHQYYIAYIQWDDPFVNAKMRMNLLIAFFSTSGIAKV